ncbi:MAG: CHC2 zinc finger domain-containing protein [Patescibacteria group bacterium]|nr:CHC2 zinc finger domain-containing protein [Patescibacteria group bacterium]
MDEVEEIKRRINVADFIGQYVTLKKAGANYKTNCPFHQEKTASFMVSPDKQLVPIV